MDENNSTTATTGSDWRALGPLQVADVLGISERGLRNLRADDPTFPKPRMVGRKPRWCGDQVRDWVRGDDQVAKPQPQPQRRRRGRV